MVLWDDSGAGVCNVKVVRHPATVRHPQTFSDGACWSDWATGKRRPADLFGQLLAQEFASPVEQRRALDEFARVTGCGWAGRMLAGLQAWGESTGEDDRIAALEQQNAALKATTKKLSRLADAAMRQLPPEARAKLYEASSEART